MRFALLDFPALGHRTESAAGRAVRPHQGSRDVVLKVGTGRIVLGIAGAVGGGPGRARDAVGKWSGAPWTLRRRERPGRGNGLPKMPASWWRFRRHPVPMVVAKRV
jgi:hypothetical protein